LSSQFADRSRFKEWSMAFVGDSDALRDHFATHRSPHWAADPLAMRFSILCSSLPEA
jgi:hypothetical protein